MNELYLFQELANVIDESLLVQYGDNTECDIDAGIISIGKSNVIDYVIEYTTIDLGYNYTKYCSSKLYWFIHELGHYVNGWVDKDEYITYMLSCMFMNSISAYEYVRLTDEILANEWAVEFIKKNKKIIKRIDEELTR